MTPAQRKVYDALVLYWRERGYAPSYDDLREACGFRSRHTIACHLDALERLGAVTREPGRSRSLRPVVAR
mgnify:CR=1 FL=1